MNNPMYWERAVAILWNGESEARYEEAVDYISSVLPRKREFANVDEGGLRDWVVGREWRDGETVKAVREELKEYLQS